MANYLGTARSNYVFVDDTEKFLETMAYYDVEVIYQTDAAGQRTGRVGIMDNHPDGGGWSWVRRGIDEDGEDADFEQEDPVNILGPLLQDGEVMVLLESGHEKYRYVTGVAIAFNRQLEVTVIDIHDIYDQALELKGPDHELTEAAY